MHAHARTPLDPRALEILRRRVGKSVSQVLRDAEMDADDFRDRIRGEGFGRQEVSRLARALETTPRQLTTTSTVVATAHRLRRGTQTLPDE